MLKKLFWPNLIIFSAVITSILAWGNWGGALRAVFLFAFIFIFPGLAFTQLLHLADPLDEFVLGIALSLVISTLLAELMVLTRLWSPALELVILIGVSLLGAALQINYALNPLSQAEK